MQPRSKTTNLRISDFCHFVEGGNGLTALYNALTLGVVIVDRNTADFLRNARHRVFPSDQLNFLSSQERNNLVKQLIRHKLIFPLGQRPDLEEYIDIQAKLRGKGIGILYLLMTDACNLGCAYCFIESAMPQTHRFSKMSEKTARCGIDLFAKALRKENSTEGPQIIFYGGEPFLNFAVVKAMLQYIEGLKRKGELPQDTSITINTNGTLVDQTIVSVLRGVEKLNVAISLDGPREFHDRYRMYRNRYGTFDDVIRGYRLLAENGVNVGPCCTISKHNVDQLEDISRWFVDELGATSISFNILIESDGIESIRGDAEIYAQKTARQIINCYRFFRERGIYEDRIMRKVNAFVEGYIYYNDCAGCGEQIVVAPDGMIGVCQGYCGSREYFVHPSESFDPISHPVWEEWRFRSPLYMEQCRDCIALSICGGGCPYSAHKSHGSIWELDGTFCIHAKATVEFLVKDLMEKMSSEERLPFTHKK